MIHDGICDKCHKIVLIAHIYDQWLCAECYFKREQGEHEKWLANTTNAKKLNS